MKLAFYAPMKAPDHPIPSGDRAMARGILAALEKAGHESVVASDLRLFEPRGDRAAQDALRVKSEA